MNRFKEDMLKELQEVKLTTEKKQAIAQKARHKSIRRSSPWQYRVVLTTFTVFVISFVFLLSNKKDQQLGSQQATNIQQETWSILGLLENDFVKGILIFSIFQLLALFLRRYLKKKKYGLPVCIQCGESWSKKQAHMLFWKNNAKPITCKHCGKKQYRTNKSMQLNGLVQLPLIQLLFLVNFNFNNILVGIAFYVLSIPVYHFILSPYIFALQENDPMKEPQKPLW